MKKLCLSVILSALTLTACSETERLPEGHPADRTYYSHSGLFAKSKVAVSTNQTVTWIQHVLANYKRRNTEVVPATLSVLPVQNGCTFPKPAAGSRVAYVHIGSTFPRSSVYAINEKSILSGAKSIAGQRKKFGKVKDKGRVVAGTEDALKVIDLAVTDNAQPLHLVLVGADNKLWNLHLFPGVDVTGISVMGGQAAGIAGLTEPIAMSYMSTDQLEKCGAPPARKPSKNWKSMDSKSFARKANGSYNRFSSWFRKSFGPIDTKNSITAMAAWHAIYGPAPNFLNERQPHRSLEGTAVYVSDPATAFAGSRSDYQKRKYRAAEARANQLSGGS